MPSVSRRPVGAAGWPPLSRTKDITYHPYFRGAISRWAWRFYTGRLTPASRWLLGVTQIFMMLGSNSLDLQMYVPFAYTVGIWLVAVACSHAFLPKVDLLPARHATRIGMGETLSVEIDVEQRRNMLGVPMTLLPFRLPPALDAVPEEGVRMEGLARGQQMRVRLGLRCLQRGLHRWHGFRVESDFPFGLLRAYRLYEQPHDVLVYPLFTLLTHLQIPTSLRYQPGGVNLASSLGETFEYIGNREYREGDNIRDIDWRATARLNIPIVREFREEYFLRVGVVLDTHVPEKIKGKSLRAKDRQAYEENFERAISLTAAVGDYMARSDYLVDLFAAGPNLFHLTAGRSLAYLEQILDILAAVEASPVEPFDTLEPEILSHLAQITTIVCLFLDWDAARQAFVQRLQREGASVKIIVVRDKPCTLDPYAANVPGGITLISKADFLSGIEEI